MPDLRLSFYVGHKQDLCFVVLYNNEAALLCSETDNSAIRPFSVFYSQVGSYSEVVSSSVSGSQSRWQMGSTTAIIELLENNVITRNMIIYN